MKRLYAISFIAILFSILMIGCTNKKGIESNNANQSSSQSKVSQASEDIVASKQTSQVKIDDQPGTPTVFIHGFGGTDFAFNGMLSRFETEGYGKRQLTLTVQPDGSITETGEWEKGSFNPFIQVLFTDNKNNEWNQADWIKAVLIYLKGAYQVDEVNLVGHSMGGVSSFRYLVTDGNQTTQPKVKRLVAIGAPLNDFVTGNENQTLEELHQDGPLVSSERYNDFSKAIQQYPLSTKMLNIVGDVEDGSKSDGTVLVSSGLSIGSLMKSNSLNYREEIITGKQAYHNLLHENERVDQLISEFLELRE